MTFNERVKARWWASVIMFAVGFVVAQGLVWLMISFIAFTALKAGGYDLSFEMKRMVMIIIEILIGMVSLWMWIVRGFQLPGNIDIRNASPLQKRMVAVQLNEDADEEPNYVKAVDAVIEQEGAQVIDVTGGPARAQP
jgi:hypothetical protein